MGKIAAADQATKEASALFHSGLTTPHRHFFHQSKRHGNHLRQSCPLGIATQQICTYASVSPQPSHQGDSPRLSDSECRRQVAKRQTLLRLNLDIKKPCDYGVINSFPGIHSTHARQIMQIPFSKNNQHPQDTRIAEI